MDDLFNKTPTKRVISSDEIERVARERDAWNVNSKLRTVYVDDYEIKGIAGEISLGEFFGVDYVPRGDLVGGDGGKDLTLPLIGRDGVLRPHKIDVKCAAKPTYLWVEPPKKDRGYADVYVLAKYNETTKLAKCIKWQWGVVVQAAPVTFYGKHHHEIPATRCLHLDELKARYERTLPHFDGRAFIHRCCECDRPGVFGHGVSLKSNQLGRWFCRAHNQQGANR